MPLSRCNGGWRPTSRGPRKVKRPNLFRRPSSPAGRSYARASLDGGRTPWRDARYCVVDLELSGLDPLSDEIISFAAVPIDSGRIIAGDAMYGLCRPTRPVPEQSILIHGLRTLDLEEAPPIDEAIQPLLGAMAGRVTVAHVAWVERSFLGRALSRQGIRLREPILDTYEMGRLLATTRHDSPPPLDLSDLAESLALPVHRPHHALGDALTTAQVFLALATHLDELSPETVKSLARARARARDFTV